jgi:integrase
MSEKRIKVWVQRFKDRPHLVLQWLDPDTGRRKSRSAETADEKEAEAKRGDLESDLNNGRYQEASRMTWERFRELFEQEYAAGCRENTRLNYQATFDLFERLCNPGQVRSITERTVSTFAAALRKEPGKGKSNMMASTVKVRLQFLHTALSWAVEQGLLPKCPRFPSVKVPEKLPQPVPVEAFERLADKAPDLNMRAYLFTAWLAGLRLEEAYNLEWERTDEAPYVDLAASKIVLPAELVKAGRDQWVPLDPALREVLLRLPRQGKKVFRFVSRKGGGPISASAVSDRVARLAKEAGVKLTYHTLRKGFGCRYAGKVPAQVLQKLMRHRSIRTTMAYYVNVDEAAMEAVLGPQRNSSRNTQAAAGKGHETHDSASPLPADESSLR